MYGSSRGLRASPGSRDAESRWIAFADLDSVAPQNARHAADSKRVPDAGQSTNVSAVVTVASPSQAKCLITRAHFPVASSNNAGRRRLSGPVRCGHARPPDRNLCAKPVAEP